MEMAANDAPDAFSNDGDASLPLRNSSVLLWLRATLDQQIERAAKY